MPLEQFLLYIQDELRVGEIMITAVNKEGTWEGFDSDLYRKVNALVKVPLIASGGAGTSMDIRRILYDENLDAAAIGSMTVYQKKGMGVLISFPKRDTIIDE